MSGRSRGSWPVICIRRLGAEGSGLLIRRGKPPPQVRFLPDAQVVACHHNTRSGPPWHGRLQTGTARRARSRQDGRHARRRRTCTTEGPGRTSRPSVGQGNRVLRSSVECSPDCRSGDRGFESRQDRRGPDNEPPEAHDHSPTVRFQPVARPGASTTGLSPVAQSAERPPVKRMVPGSSPGWGAVPFQRHAARGWIPESQQQSWHQARLAELEYAPDSDSGAPMGA